jgi:hypothetical protein
MELGRRGTLTLTDLSKGLPAITPAFGQMLAEAGAVCFQDQRHPNGVELKVDGTFQAGFEVFWQQVTEQMIRCYNDKESTTELGAYGVAFLLVLNLTDYTIIRRSRRGTGFDYWLGTAQDDAELPFQNKERLEVSGMRSGDSGRVKARVNEKLKQVQPSDSSALPALIVVVEFSAPLSEMARNERN